MRLSFDDEDSFKEAAAGRLGSLQFNNPPSDPDSLALQRVGSNSSIPSQERDEDIRYTNNPSESITIRQLGVGSNSSTLPQEMIEVS